MELFQSSKANISDHIKHIFEEGELDENSVVRKFRTTAAEIIVSRTDESKSNMRLTTWKHAPEGKILKTDVLIAKNYLSEKEISELNRLVNMYLDYAELQAARQIPMKMKD